MPRQARIDSTRQTIYIIDMTNLQLYGWMNFIYTVDIFFITFCFAWNNNYRYIIDAFFVYYINNLINLSFTYTLINSHPTSQLNSLKEMNQNKV